MSLVAGKGSPVAYLLNLIYLGLLVLLSPLLIYSAIVKGKYRQGFAEKFLGLAPRRDGDAFCLWFHAVSVGEVNLLKPLIDRIKTIHPDWECVISTTTKTGYALAGQKYEDHLVFYCPLDFSWATRTAMRRLRPDLLLLAELELWPNLIRFAKARGASVGIVNGRLSQKSFRGYRRLRPLVRNMLQRLDLIAVQNVEYAERFADLGARAEVIHVTGSAKFDDAQTDRCNPATQWLRQLAGFHDDDVVFLAGSTQHPEEKLALKAFRKLSSQHPRLRLVLVPRHAERFDQVARMLRRSKLPWQRRTELGGSKTTKDSDAGSPRILLVDTIGELGAWWGTADIAFVGGSLGRRGGQNMIEPAAYGAAVSFGPNTRNFRDIVDAMLEEKAAVVVTGGKQLTGFVRQCLERPAFAQRLGRRAQALVVRQQGATEKTVRLLEELADSADVRISRRKAA